MSVSRAVADGRVKWISDVTVNVTIFGKRVTSVDCRVGLHSSPSRHSIILTPTTTTPRRCTATATKSPSTNLERLTNTHPTLSWISQGAVNEESLASVK